MDWFSRVEPQIGRSAALVALAQRRNVTLDRLFYDVGALSEAELGYLLGETVQEGAILVVHPRGARGSMSLAKHADHEHLRAAPGALLRHFAIAGVGSSDVGAAALARNLADHLGEPVGAIVAGYGLDDVVAEALGGWLLHAAGADVRRRLHRGEMSIERTKARYGGALAPFERREAEPVAAATAGEPDAATLLRLLLDADRAIETLLGHSKGCLAIALALEALSACRDAAALKRARAIRIVTAGAVVELPGGFTRARQFLGALDWFGGLNSRLGQAYIAVPGAWHHVNTALPLHMSVAGIVERAMAERP